MMGFFFSSCTNMLESSKRKLNLSYLFSSCVVVVCLINELTVHVRLEANNSFIQQDSTSLTALVWCHWEPASLLLDATAVWRQEWKGQRSQHLISIDQVLFQCHPRVSGVCCRCHSVLQEGGPAVAGGHRKETRQAAYGDAGRPLTSALSYGGTANVSRRSFLLDGNNAALVALCHTPHKSGLGDYLWRVLLHVWTSWRGHASKTWPSLRECLLSETRLFLETAHHAHVGSCNYNM